MISNFCLKSFIVKPFFYHLFIIIFTLGNLIVSTANASEATCISDDVVNCFGLLDNCGFYEVGNEYCLFHKPYKKYAEATLFYDELKQQAVIEIDGFGKEKFVFQNSVDWSGYVFPAYSNRMFEYATFENAANYSGTTFEDLTSFYRVTFKGPVDFNDAIFHDSIYFYNTVFKDIVKFNNTTFGLPDNNRLADFRLAIFENRVEFKGACFKGRTSFSYAIFKEFVTFENAVFVDTSSQENFTDFRSAKFYARANFYNTTFNCLATFQDAIFKDVANFTVGDHDRDESSERGIVSTNNYCGDMNYQGATFERMAYFTNRKFGEGLYFRNTDFRQGVQMEADWKDPEEGKYLLLQAEQEGCRVQRLSYEKEGNSDAADSMFAREMRARRAERINDKPILKNILLYISTWAEYLFVDLTSEYGTNLGRLLVIAGGTIIAFTLAYYIFGGVYSSSQDNTQDNRFLKMLYFSIATFSHLKSTDIYVVGKIKYAVLLQSLTGTLFIALLIAVFVRVWMR